MGFVFPWRRHQVTVTSFAADGKHLTACAYTDGTDRKVSKRFRITVADIRADRKQRKDLMRLHDRLLEMDDADKGFLKAFASRAGITKYEDWDRMPPAKIRSLIETLANERKQAA